jgi:hypothetical protein
MTLQMNCKSLQITKFRRKKIKKTENKFGRLK